MIDTNEILGCLTVTSIGVFILIPLIELIVVIIKTVTHVTSDFSSYLIATYKKPQLLENQLKLAVDRHNHLTDNLLKQAMEIKDLNSDKLKLSGDNIDLVSETKVLNDNNLKLIKDKKKLENVINDLEIEKMDLKNDNEELRHENLRLKVENDSLTDKVKLLESNLQEIDFELDDLLEERPGWERDDKPTFCIGIDEELQNDDIASVSDLDSIQAGSPIFMTQPRDIEAYCYEADIDSDVQYDSDTVVYE